MGKEGKRASQGHVQRTHGHGQWVGITCGRRGEERGEATREKVGQL